MEKEYLSLGKVNDAFGLDGTLKIYSTTNLGEKRYKKGASVFLYSEANNERIECKVITYRHQGLFDFVKLDSINSIDDAISKKGYEIQVIKDRNDLGKNTYFYSDLRGCKIVDNSGNNLGIVKEIEEFPAQLTLRVSRKNQPDFFIPFIDTFIVSVDIDNKTVVINVIPGLL